MVLFLLLLHLMLVSNPIIFIMHSAWWAKAPSMTCSREKQSHWTQTAVPGCPDGQILWMPLGQCLWSHADKKGRVGRETRGWNQQPRPCAELRDCCLQSLRPVLWLPEWVLASETGSSPMSTGNPRRPVHLPAPPRGGSWVYIVL